MCNLSVLIPIWDGEWRALVETVDRETERQREGPLSNYVWVGQDASMIPALLMMFPGEICHRHLHLLLFSLGKTLN